MIALFTDFGLAGPYTGQMKAVLHRIAPAAPVIDLFADAPRGRPKLCAYLLAAYAPWFAAGTVLLCVVDPGVGSERAALVVEADGRSYVGPDNGLFELVLRRAARSRIWRISWRPQALSASFHGRDLFAPIAGRLARGAVPEDALQPIRAEGIQRFPQWPDDLAEIVYIDHFGNAMTGLRAGTLPRDTRLGAGGRELASAQTFSAVPPGAAFWYENANGLAEVAVNDGSAGRTLGLEPGSPIAILR